MAAADLSFTDALVQLSYAVQGVLAEVGERDNLSLTQVRLLGVLRDRALRMHEIAAVLGLEKSSTTGLVDRAERRGLLVRSPSGDDGRSTVVTLSPTGRRHVARAARAVDRMLLDRASALSPRERAELAHVATVYVTGPE